MRSICDVIRFYLGVFLPVTILSLASSTAVASSPVNLAPMVVTATPMVLWNMPTRIPYAWAGEDGDLGNPGSWTGYEGQVHARPAPEYCVGNPVALETGGKLEREVDFESQGEMGLGITRTYLNAFDQPMGMGIFGSGWRSQFENTLSRGLGEGGPFLLISRPSGEVKRFKRVIIAGSPTTTGRLYEEEGSEAIEYVTDGIADGNGITYKYFVSDGSVETYSMVSGQMLSRYKNGIGWELGYEYGTWGGTNQHRLLKVTHTSGKEIQFQYVTPGQLTKVIDPDGNVYSYTFDYSVSSGLVLTSVTLPGSPSTTIQYHYSGPNLAGKSYGGVRYSTFTYDNQYRVVSEEHAGGVNRRTFQYADITEGGLTYRRVIETNPLGKVTQYKFLDGRLVSVTGHPSTYCNGDNRVLAYTADTYPASVQDANGNVTLTTYNPKGQLLEKQEAAGTGASRTTSYTWYESGHLLESETLHGVRSTQYTYTSNGRLASVRETNLSSNGVYGQQRVINYSYTYHSNGMLATEKADGPISGSSDAVTRSYDALGNLISIKNGLGHEVKYQNHTGLGYPRRVIGINGDITDYTYDARGRVTQVRTYPNESTASQVSYTYNDAGLLSIVGFSDGRMNILSYDAARRLTAVYELFGSRYDVKAYSYDNASNVTMMGVAQLLPTGRLVSLESILYDELGRVRARLGNNGQDIRYTYDLNGNVITENRNGRTTSLTYDALDHLVSSTDPAGGTTWFSYDAEDRLIQVTDPRNLVTAYVYDGFSQLWSQASPDAGVTTFQYNAAGLRTNMTRSNGIATTYQYDGLGRLTNQTAGGQTMTFTYDSCTNGKGRLCNANAPNSSVRHTYEKDGRIRARRELITGNGTQTDHTTTYGYNTIGRLTPSPILTACWSAMAIQVRIRTT